MIPQNNDFDAIQQAIHQAYLEGDIPEQAEQTPNEAQRQIIKFLLIGSPEIVNSIIHHLQLIGYAEVGDWSRSLPVPSSPEEVMRILLRKIKVQ